MINDGATLASMLAFAGLGLIAGSFIGLVSLRFPVGESVVLGRSRCGECRQTLSAQHLIPVVSYLVAGGRCSRCGASIPRRYPLIELACAAIGAWAVLTQPVLSAAALTALLGWQLLLIAIVDAEHFWLPDQLTLPLLAVGVAAAAVLENLTIRDSLIGAVAGFSTLWLLARAYRTLRGREGLGGGDPWLFGAIGAWVGWIGLPTVLVWAATAGLSWVLARRLTGRAVSGSDRLAFGVFLAVGGWLTWLYGPLGL